MTYTAHHTPIVQTQWQNFPSLLVTRKETGKSFGLLPPYFLLSSCFRRILQEIRRQGLKGGLFLLLFYLIPFRWLSKDLTGHKRWDRVHIYEWGNMRHTAWPRNRFAFVNKTTLMHYSRKVVIKTKWRENYLYSVAISVSLKGSSSSNKIYETKKKTRKNFPSSFRSFTRSLVRQTKLKPIGINLDTNLPSLASQAASWKWEKKGEGWSP